MVESSTVYRFSDKTHNEWEDRAAFVKHEGKYDLLAMDYTVKVWGRKGEGRVGIVAVCHECLCSPLQVEGGEEVDAPPPAVPPLPPQSKLDKRVQVSG